jgi:undecaprenyl-diphosphatase
MRPRPLVVFDRLDLVEWQLCQRVSRLSLYRPWRLILQAASRLGDWPVWVLLILAQPWLQPNGAWRLMQYSVIALFAVAVYRLVKTRLCRERPFITYSEGIQCCEPARDRYSFPSGHTMHAVMFSVLVAAHTPWLLPVVLPLTLLIAISRVGLGLHYVSDVLAGAALGYAFALFSLYWMG